MKRAAAIALCAGFWGCGSGSGEPAVSMGEAANAPAPSTNVTLRTPPQGVQTDGIVTKGVPGTGYAGGPLVTGPIQLVPIFYGTAWQPGYQQKILAFLGTMSSTSYWGVVEEYSDSAGNKPGAVSVEATAYETDYAYGKSLTPENIAGIVQSQGVPVTHHPPGNTVYLVFTADDVNQVDSPSATGDQPGSFCTKWLGWHWYGSFTYHDPERRLPQHFTTEYAWIGSLNYCLNQGLPGLQPKWVIAPNGAIIDQAISAALHELAEIATDPFGGSGWVPEIGDLCNWTPGPEETQFVCVGANCYVGGQWDLGGGAPYTSNELGYSHNQGPRYLVQTLWDTSQKGCAYGPATLDGP